MRLSDSDEPSVSGRAAEPAAIMDLSSAAKLRNILLYGIQLHQSKVSSWPFFLKFFQTKQPFKCLVPVTFVMLFMLQARLLSSITPVSVWSLRKVHVVAGINVCLQVIDEEGRI